MMPAESLFSSKEAAVWPAVVSECTGVVEQVVGGQTEKWAKLLKWLWHGWHSGAMVITVASQQGAWLLDPYSRNLFFLLG